MHDAGLEERGTASHCWCVEVTVEESDAPEEEAKEEPGDQEGSREDHKHVAPARVHTGGKDVGHVALRLVAQVGKVDIALPILLHKTVAVLPPGGMALPVPAVPVHAAQRRDLVSILFSRDDAVPGREETGIASRNT